MATVSDEDIERFEARLAAGYAANSQMNLELAEEFAASDAEAWELDSIPEEES